MIRPAEPVAPPSRAKARCRPGSTSAANPPRGARLHEHRLAGGQDRHGRARDRTSVPGHHPLDHPGGRQLEHELGGARDRHVEGARGRVTDRTRLHLDPAGGEAGDAELAALVRGGRGALVGREVRTTERRTSTGRHDGDGGEGNRARPLPLDGAPGQAHRRGQLEHDEGPLLPHRADGLLERACVTGGRGGDEMSPHRRGEEEGPVGIRQSRSRPLPPVASGDGWPAVEPDLGAGDRPTGGPDLDEESSGRRVGGGGRRGLAVRGGARRRRARTALGPGLVRLGGRRRRDPLRRTGREQKPGDDRRGDRQEQCDPAPLGLLHASAWYHHPRRRR